MNLPLSTTMTEKETALEFLRQNKLGVLATITPEGKPHADAIYYVVDDGLEVNFLTEIETSKYRNIQHLPDVFFVVTDVEKKITAHIIGKASLVTDKDSLTAMMGKVAKMLNSGESFDTVLPILKRDDGNLVVVRIKPEEIRLSDYGGNGLSEITVTF